ncbi:phosphotransferase [Flexithrix dorotheae]|uniref:phosphotransferase n=1 Tax=Flexithrix dorotheae TaxID=70993 RepID=UPI00037AE458|nr:phosphotransferase [Flexithrix dorotheae]
MNQQEKFLQEYPDKIYLKHDDTELISNYLQQEEFLEKDEKVIGMEKPGEGNMNFVARINTNHRSFILKQSRPWVEKYPQISAPIDRINVESKIYRLIRQNKTLRNFTPEILLDKSEDYILVLEDLGKGADFTYLYQKDKTIHEEELATLVGFINQLHQIKRDVASEFPGNMPMKKLNHEHIFYFPYLEENGFDLDTVRPGLQAIAMQYKKDDALKAKIATLGDIYLGEGNTLIHGDYYPGSWLRVTSGIKIIDPEFGYFGKPEFDLGVFTAHLKMAQVEQESIDFVLENYDQPAGFDPQLCQSFTGVEILRRIIGLAQLPLDLTLNEKEALLKEAVRLIKN